MKKLNKLILFFIIAFIGLLSINAFENSIGPISEGGSASYNGYDTFHMKYYGSTAVFCTNFGEATPAGTGVSCTKSNWSDKISIGVAAIIRSAGATGTTMSQEYYNAEVAINRFLKDYNGCTTCTVSGNCSGDALCQVGVAAMNNYVSEATLSLSTSTLTFTKNGDNYVSNNITVTTNTGNYSVETNLGTAVKNGNSFYITVPSSQVTSGNEVNLTVTVTSGSITQYYAQNYSCGSYQSVTPNHTESRNLSKNATASGKISRTKLTIRKIDDKGNYISGVKIKVENSDKSYSQEFTTENKEIVIEDLELGDYTVTEIEAASGYDLSKEKYNVSLTANKLSDTVVIENNETETKISKKSAVNGEELPGATLQVLDKDKKEMSCKIKNSEGKIEILEKCEWVSTDKPVSVIGLEKGKYYLKETIAPEGYILSDNTVEFEVKADGTVTEVEMINELEVEVPDTLSARSALLLTIAMFDIALGIGIITYVKKNKVTE